MCNRKKERKFEINLDLLKSAIDSSNHTAIDVCKSAGVSIPTYRSIVAGYANPTTDTVGRLADTLNLDLNELIIEKRRR